MTRFVVDPSVAVKLVVPEELSEAAVRLHDDAEHLMSNDLLTIECANLLRTKVGRGLLRPGEAAEALQLIQGSRIELARAAGYVEPAFKLALELGHAVYDCLYLAQAIRHDMILVSDDERFFARVRRNRTLRRHMATLRSFA